MAAQQNLQPLLDAAQAQAGTVLATSDSYDAKALGVAGFNIAVAIFTLQSQMQNTPWLLIPLLACQLLSVVLDIVIIFPRNYIGPAVDLDRHPEYLRLHEQELVLKLLANTQAAIAVNNQFNLTKSRYLVTSICLSLASITLLIGCIL